MKRIAAAVLAIAVCLTGAITLSSCVPEELSGYTYEFVEVKELFYGDGHYSRQKYAEAVAAISEDYADALTSVKSRPISAITNTTTAPYITWSTKAITTQKRSFLRARRSNSFT